MPLAYCLELCSVPFINAKELGRANKMSWYTLVPVKEGGVGIKILSVSRKGEQVSGTQNWLSQGKVE